jgi:hypothetical protein
VSVVRFFSTHLNTISASMVGGPPVVVAGPTTHVGPTSGRGCRLVLEKSVGHTGPTSIHNRYVSFRYSGIPKNDIYKET